MFELNVELIGETPAELVVFASAISAVREVHSMAREYCAQQEDAADLRKALNVLFGTPSQQDTRLKMFAASLRGKNVSKTWPNGLPGQPVKGRIGNFSFSINVAPVVVVAEAEAITEEAVAA